MFFCWEAKIQELSALQAHKCFEMLPNQFDPSIKDQNGKALLFIIFFSTVI